MSQRKQRSKAEWRNLIEQQVLSGLNDVAFCAQRGLSRKTFYRHRRVTGEVKPGNAGNLATDTASTFGIKLKAIDKNFTRAMQQNDRAFRMRAVTASMRSIRRQFQNRQISREEYEAAMARARAKIQRIKETGRAN